MYNIISISWLHTGNVTSASTSTVPSLPLCNQSAPFYVYCMIFFSSFTPDDDDFRNHFSMDYGVQTSLSHIHLKFILTEIIIFSRWYVSVACIQITLSWNTTIQTQLYHWRTGQISNFTIDNYPYWILSNIILHVAHTHMILENTLCDRTCPCQCISGSQKGFRNSWWSDNQAEVNFPPTQLYSDHPRWDPQRYYW